MDLNAYFEREGAESMAEFAARIGLRGSDQVRQWRHGYDGRRPGPETCSAIECATNGAVPCEDLRPDIRWHRVKDPAWPWHPKGRPLIDVTTEAS